MSPPNLVELDERVLAFDGGRGWVRPDARVVRVSGGDARRWLDDLVTAGITRLGPQQQTRSLLLSPTGRIRADVHVIAGDRSFALVQSRDQPASILDLLRPYVLSSDVDLEEAAGADVRLVADRPDPRVVVGDADVATELSIDVFEAWRVRRGLARFPVDLDADSTPAEAGLDRLVDVTKGCFLGQEAVAKIRNLGHPARVVVAMSAPAGAAPGDTVSVGGRAVGTITSAAPADGSTAVIARVAWRDRDADLSCPAGPLMRR